MSTVYIGIDNGSSGSVAVLGLPTGAQFMQVPTIEVQDYTKAKQRTKRLDHAKLLAYLKEIAAAAGGADRLHAVMERPLVNPTMFKTTKSAVRVLEAWLILLEQVGISYRFADSREWQKVVLPQGTTGKDELKQASRDIGTRLYPQFSEVIRKQKDADGLLIAHWAMQAKIHG